MKKKHKKDPITSAMVDNWNVLMAAIYMVIFAVICTLGYLLLEDHIHAFLNQKKYSQEELEEFDRRARTATSLEEETANWDKIVKGIHIRTGLHDDPNLKLVISSCTSCHSSKLITQNKASRSGWKAMIKWMQETQGLPDLGSAEPKILDYLAKYYAPTETGRRKNLDVKNIEWYVHNTLQ